MAYEPMFLDASRDTVTVIINTGGRVYSGNALLGEAWEASQGPMSLESGALSALREVCRRICREAGGEA